MEKYRASQTLVMLFFSKDLDDYFHSFLIVGEVGNTVQNSNRYFDHYITKILLHKQRNGH